MSQTFGDLRRRLARSKLSRKAKAVGHYLLSLMLKFGRANCWPSHARIALATGYSVSSVQRALGELRTAGWLCQRQRKTRASIACRRLVANLYWFATEVLGSVKMTERKLPISVSSFSFVKTGNDEVRVQPVRAALQERGYRRDPFRSKDEW